MQNAVGCSRSGICAGRDPCLQSGLHCRLDAVATTGLKILGLVQAAVELRTTCMTVCALSLMEHKVRASSIGAGGIHHDSLRLVIH